MSPGRVPPTQLPDVPISQFGVASDGASRHLAPKAVVDSLGVEDQRGPYYQRLSASSLPRHYWSGLSPDDPNEMWYFETVIDDGKHVAIRQLTITADGDRHAYSVDHLEDGWGFLTEQAVEPKLSEGLEAISRSKFEAAWSA